jgi:hypothetical protein
MHPARKRELLWQGVGWCCYLLGLAVFLGVAVTVYLAVPTNSFAGMDTVDLAGLLVGLALIVLGRYVTFTYGGTDGLLAGQIEGARGGHPDQTRLEELGYHIPPEAKDDGPTGYTYENGEVRLVCAECGEPNDSDFDFCRNCSARLGE